MRSSERITRSEYLRLAQRMRALAHPVRLQMLLGLCEQECHVNKIWQRLHISQPLASQHLRLLRRAGLVSAQRRGKKICYAVADPQIKRMLESLCDWVANTPD
jgi:DNA-binding transcriptional ArsR family regulator